MIRCYPNQGSYFCIGVQEIAHRFCGDECEGRFIFVEFEENNIDYILISDIKRLIRKYENYRVFLISSQKLLPLAWLYVQIFQPAVMLFRVQEPLLNIVKAMRNNQFENPSVDKEVNILSVREAIIMECTLKGLSVHRIGRYFRLHPKTIYHWRKSAEKKLGVKKMLNLRLFTPV